MAASQCDLCITDNTTSAWQLGDNQEVALSRRKEIREISGLNLWDSHPYHCGIDTEVAHHYFYIHQNTYTWDPSH